MFGFGSSETPEQAKRRRIREYFEDDTDTGAWKFLLAGLAGTILVVICIALGANVAVWGILAVVTAILFLIAWSLVKEAQNRATDEDIDIWRDEDFNKIIKLVPQKAGFEADELITPDDPIVLVGFVRWEKLREYLPKDSSNRPKSWSLIKVRFGRDGLYRWTPPCLVVLHCTTNQLIAFQCDVDLITGKTLNESAEEYFWKDIISLQVEKESVSWTNVDTDLIRQWAKARNLPKEQRKKYEDVVSEQAKDTGAIQQNTRTILRLRTTGGFGLTIVLDDKRFVETTDDAAQSGGTPTHVNDKAIARLRRLLRDRRGSEA